MTQIIIRFILSAPQQCEKLQNQMGYTFVPVQSLIFVLKIDLKVCRLCSKFGKDEEFRYIPDTYVAYLWFCVLFKCERLLRIEQLRKKHAKDDGGSNNKWSSHSGGNSMHSAKARLRASGVSLTRCPSQNSRSVKSACIKDSIAQQMVGSGSGQTGSGQMLQQRYQSGERRSVS